MGVSYKEVLKNKKVFDCVNESEVDEDVNKS